jgi:hypothetical protein
MPALPIISAGTSILGGILGSSAASKAAKQQQAAANAVAGQIDKSTGDAIKAGYDGITQSNAALNAGHDAALGQVDSVKDPLKNLYGDMSKGIAGYDAYKDAGLTGLDKLKSSAGTFSFNPSDLENDPGYQFQRDQGMKALSNSYAGRGMLLSGANLKAALNYNQGLAGTAYGNAYQRALSTYNTNQQGFQNLANLGMNANTAANSQQLQAGSIYGGQLTNLAGLGANIEQHTGDALSNTAMQGNQWIGQTGIEGAKASGDARMGGANAAAAGTIGAANAWTGALGGVGNAAMGAYSLSKLGATPGGGATHAYTPGGGSVYSPWAAPASSGMPISLSNMALPDFITSAAQPGGPKT